MKPALYVVLLHHPVQNRRGETVASSVTNLDIHDIARTSRTYGANNYYIVTPIIEQHAIVQRILGHWHLKRTRDYHPDRVEALDLVVLKSTLDEVLLDIEQKEGHRAEVVFTDAREFPQSIGFGAYRKELESPDRSRAVVLVLGTAWGIAPDFYRYADRILDPIYGREGKTGYNHLSVRGAAAVLLDRLFGQ
jgi:hypothetical protein